jgi:peptide/nickel transport system ATP-binding protein
MHRGRLVEQGPVRQILRAPAHEYTKSLLAAVPGMRTGDRT